MVEGDAPIPLPPLSSALAPTFRFFLEPRFVPRFWPGAVRICCYLRLESQDARPEIRFEAVEQGKGVLKGDGGGLQVGGWGLTAPSED